MRVVGWTVSGCIVGGGVTSGGDKEGGVEKGGRKSEGGGEKGGGKRKDQRKPQSKKGGSKKEKHMANRGWRGKRKAYAKRGEVKKRNPKKKTKRGYSRKYMCLSYFKNCKKVVKNKISGFFFFFPAFSFLSKYSWNSRDFDNYYFEKLRKSDSISDAYLWVDLTLF